MSIAIVNCSGNVGKTTMTRELLAPRLPHMTVRQVESINTDESNGPEVEVMIAAHFDKLHDELMLGQELLVDIGASNVEEYLQRLKDAKGSHEDYAFFVVPTEPGKKQQKDTIKTIVLLEELRVSPERIRVLFNKVEVPKGESMEQSLQRQFAEIYQHHDRFSTFTLSPAALIPASEIFSIAAEAGITIHDIAGDDIDYKAQLASAEGDSEKRRIARLLSLKRKALSIDPQLDRAFDALMLGAAN
ncbi:StbB family protein [Burkholderia territorii]|uniref:StbB family protein n=1 Tax=Burkholderia territorii TaxID=1503055 RepID=UPI000A4EC0D9|nr:StbB family protein [Burkholderia territorii]